MTLLDVLTVALIRGLGEVLPIGASGPLAVLPGLVGSDDGRAALSIATHCGILVALLLYFWRDVLAMVVGLWRLAKGKPDAGSWLMLHVAAGTVPAAALGGFLAAPTADLIGPVLASILILLGGVILLVCDRLGVTVRRVEHLSISFAAGLGLVQALALFPGVSRTGITIATARLMGWERREAARFSLLLAIPLILGYVAVSLWQLTRHTQPILSADLQIAAIAAGMIAFTAIAAMMAWVDRHTYAPLAVARIVVGLVALGIALLSSLG
ncbi:undecaprenyl-diphosphate phosphatase [Magnetospirillum molischianum]|uniref:Undecaprenyl-diphosphatase n=1 Tax=Magnetospirillum molischianum DSM 120 TaxID=1150626 RepID=H8FU84_MAGML|nr:undecaprenyl-diphosphate phosphatase [Magnetospirillum molischianum]CCG41922.1 Undecaprenyl-diphosphatase 1 [Magnetospirillum molischianum DSM 120]